MKEVGKEKFETGGEKDGGLEEKLRKQKEKVRAIFEEEERNKELDILFKKIEELSDEEWEKLAERRGRHHDSKP